MLDGPSANCNVNCVTCHRAHAGGWESGLRWNGESEYMVYKGQYPGVDNGAPQDIAQGRTESETTQAYYRQARSKFAYDQRSLCNKCHLRD